MHEENEESFPGQSDFFREIIYSSPAPVLIADARGVCRFANQSACRFFGLSEEKMLSAALSDFVSDEYAQAFSAFIDDIAGSVENRAEIKFKRPTGEIIWGEIAARSLPNGLWQAVLTDITARKNAEEQLRISQERYQIITDTAWDAIVCLDEQGRIVFINKAAERIFGYKVEDLVGESIEKIVPLDNLEKRFRGFPELFKNGRPKNPGWNNLKLPARRADGEIFQIEVSLGEYRHDESHYFIGIARDVTFRDRAERATAHLAAIVEDSDDAIISKDLDGNVTSWNRGAENLFGYTAEEIIGRPITVLIPEQALTEESTILNKIKCGDKIEHYDTVRRCKDGSLKEVSLTVSPIKDVAGNITGASKIARDITERKRTEKDLRESQMMLALAMKSSRMGVWEHDIAAGIVRWSPELEEIFGLRRGEFKGTRSAFYELIHPADREQVFSEVETAVKEKRDYAVEFRFLHKDGSVRWMEGRGQAVYAEDGSPVRVYGSGMDITERKRAEEKLKESEKLFRMMADNISHFAWMADENGNRFWFNRQWFEYTGTTFEEMKGMGWKKIHHPEHIDRVLKNLEKCWKTGEIWEDTFPLRGKDGQYRWFLSRALPIRDESGKIIRWFGTNTDITDRKIAEEALVAANRSKDEFLSILSHELRTPLNSILGWIKMLRAGGLDEEKIARAHETIERNARLQCNLIEDLLDVSRIISGKMRIEKMEVDLAAVAASSANSVRPLAEAKQLSLKYSSEIDSLIIYGDQNRLQQIIVNLANNAIKFTPAGGNVSIKLSKTESSARLEIIDTGIGIGADFLPYIFDRFSQADTTTRRNFSGLGLGLTIVKHLVELHGGSISVTSGGTGKGSVFTLDFPLQRDQGPEENFLSEIKRPGRTGAKLSFEDKKILLVDDDCDGIEPLQILFESYGAQVVCADSPVAAFECLKADAFDLIISDIGMPGTDGYQFVRDLKRLDDYRRIPTIALTAFAGPDARRQALDAGFSYHHSKPVDHQLLLKTVSGFLYAD